MSVHGLFRQRDENIARSRDLIHARNRLRTERHRCDSLRAADLENLGNADFFRRKQHIRIDFPFTRRTHHDDFPHAGHRSRHRVHHDGGWISGRTARNIKSDAIERQHGLSKKRTFLTIRQPGFRLLFLMITAHICDRPAQGRHDLFIDQRFRFFELRLADEEILRRKLRTVDELRISHDGGVAFTPYVADNLRHNFRSRQICAEKFFITLADCRTQLHLVERGFPQKTFDFLFSAILHIDNSHYLFSSRNISCKSSTKRWIRSNFNR